MANKKTVRGCLGRDRIVLDLLLPMQSLPITTNVVSSNPVHDEVYSIQLCVIKFVSDLRQVCGFLRVLRFPPPIKLTHDITEILLKVALNNITLTLSHIYNLNIRILKGGLYSYSRYNLIVV
jgi:hypothetical protein